MLKKLVNNGVLVAILVLAGFTTLYLVSANAKEGSPADTKWHICAQKSFVNFQNLPLEVQENKVCRFLGTEKGPSCDAAVQGFHRIGRLQGLMQQFYMEEIVMPKCGPHPQ